MHDHPKHVFFLSCMLAALCGCDSGETPGDGGSAEASTDMVRCDGAPGGFCPCRAHDDGSTRYLFCPDAVTWEEARDNCRSFGFELVRIDSEVEQAFVWSAAEELAGDFWIGLNDMGTEGVYVWSDGAPLGSYTSWAAMAPNDGDLEVPEDCVEIVNAEEGRWNDRDCATDYLDYICEGPL